MWYYDTHLQYRKGQYSTAVFAFVNHVPDMACKMATIEANTFIILRHGGPPLKSHNHSQTARFLEGLPLYLHFIKHAGRSSSHIKQSGCSLGC